MGTSNTNFHVVYDGARWAVAVEGEGRVEVGVTYARALDVATFLAAQNGALLYVHDKDGTVARRLSFS